MIHRLLLLVLFVGLAVSTTGHAETTGIDCTSSATPIAHFACSDGETRELAQSIDQEFADRLTAAAAESARESALQHEWLDTAGLLCGVSTVWPVAEAVRKPVVTCLASLFRSSRLGKQQEVLDLSKSHPPARNEAPLADDSIACTGGNDRDAKACRLLLGSGNVRHTIPDANGIALVVAVPKGFAEPAWKSTGRHELDGPVADCCAVPVFAEIRKATLPVGPDDKPAIVFQINRSTGYTSASQTDKNTVYVITDVANAAGIEKRITDVLNSKSQDDFDRAIRDTHTSNTFVADPGSGSRSTIMDQDSAVYAIVTDHDSRGEDELTVLRLLPKGVLASIGTYHSVGPHIAWSQTNADPTIPCPATGDGSISTADLLPKLWFAQPGHGDTSVSLSGAQGTPNAVFVQQSAQAGQFAQASFGKAALGAVVRAFKTGADIETYPVMDSPYEGDIFINNTRWGIYYEQYQELQDKVWPGRPANRVFYWAGPAALNTEKAERNKEACTFSAYLKFPHPAR